MIAYRYTLNNQTVETTDLKSIPKDLTYETFDLVLVSENPIIETPTKEQLIQTVQNLEEQINEIKEQINNL